jgi:ribosomal protein L11 methyltransferase
VPYRIDLRDPPADALDRLVELGALDVEPVRGGLAALMPDSVSSAHVAAALGVDDLIVSPARGRDGESVWILSPREVRVGQLLIVPANQPAAPGALRLIDGPAFGTGVHPTTALCLEALSDAVSVSRPARLLDVGTGSGVLALAALRLGVARAVGLDLDPDALRIAAENAQLNDLAERLVLVGGGPDVLSGSWPLVVANVLAAPLMEMAPTLIRRVGHGGRLIVSGIPTSLSAEVEQTYCSLGMRSLGLTARAGWSALVLGATW